MPDAHRESKTRRAYFIKNGNTFLMREATNNISVAVERVKNLKGIDLKLLINRGRNRFIRVDGVIEDLYPNVFTVKTEDAHTKILTLTYADVMMKTSDSSRAEKRKGKQTENLSSY